MVALLFISQISWDFQIEAEDITEAARSRNLTVFVPPEASKAVDHEAAVLLHSPGSSTVVSLFFQFFGSIMQLPLGHESYSITY